MGLSPTTENGISYVCGGIGSTEAAQMKRNASRYQLMLTFAENTGDYLASVDVGIADARGNSIMQTTCDAPIMLVNFPRAGTYRINAKVDGVPVNRVVRIKSGTRGNSVAMLWPRTVIEGRTGNAQG
ncbi:MAG TPA: carboxypeptidase regulatory-like domain-containing protein [Janthinobacterium sp.]|nr:carboxypeptidase regulatory-like domain-containing protein [Janthinobacterium sp.]